jgi:hypothetical protein
MPNDSLEDNRVYCKAYYERTKLDPLKLANRQAKKAAAQKARRAKERGITCDLTVTSPVTSNAISPEKTSESACDFPVASTPEDPLARIHREYKAECEALGYDVDGNRAAVLAALVEKLGAE